MEARIYIVKCLTNLHVGNGEVNFNIIDNEVEKDVVTGFPTINSSGVKGALRAYFTENKISESVITAIFGSETTAESLSQGQLKFLNAKLLAQPFQNPTMEKSTKPFTLKAPETAKKEFTESVGLFVNGKVAWAENVLEKYGITSMSDTDYLASSLPVLARNHLINGIANNLWYEEIVPHQSMFYITVVSSTSDTSLLDQFEMVVKDKIVQFGANASIGYGLCQFVDVLKAGGQHE